MDKYYTYIIQSLKDESFYIGYSSKLDERLNSHNNGQSKDTPKKGPLEISLL